MDAAVEIFELQNTLGAVVIRPTTSSSFPTRGVPLVDYDRRKTAASKQQRGNMVCNCVPWRKMV
jgi:hypothetical protein